MYKSINPANGRQSAVFESLTDVETEQKIQLAQNAYIHWAENTFSDRKMLMLNLANNLLENKLRYAQIITEEMGKPIRQSIAEVEKCAHCCKYYAEEAEQMLAAEDKKSDYTYSAIHYEPLGVIYIIMPWNFPFWQTIRCAAPAIMAGNTILLKLAENVPQCALAMEKAFTESGFPEGIFQNLFISHEQSDDVIANNLIRGVSLTGGGRAGATVASQAGKHLKKTVLELGGSDPFIVLADADIDSTAKNAANARMQNTGQSCIAAKRFIVLKEVAEAFTKAFIKEICKLKVGDPNLAETDIGPIAKKDLRDSLLKQVNDSVAKGAHILIGGKMLQGDGFYFEPTILTDIAKDSPAYNDELFGPVASLFVVDNEEEAIILANDTIFGLGASIWTKNTDKALETAKKIHSGCVYINTIVKSDPRLPFGGIKDSGFGRELSDVGIKEFVNFKTTVIG
ncbi:MAG: NAD-dependent succinate-semialdehyde dehydrogenase [Bacteroidia bacterium]